MTIEELQARKNAHADEAEGLIKKAEAENRDLTDEEKKRFDECDVEVRSCDERMERQRKIATYAAPGQRQTKPSQPDSDPMSVEPRKVFATAALPYVGRAYAGPDARRQAYFAGQWVMGHLFRRYPGAEEIAERCRQRCRDAGFESRVMVENSNTAGGYLVPEFMEANMIRLVEERGVFRREAEYVTMPGETWSRPRRTGGLTLYYPGEGVEITASDAAVDQIKLTARKAATLTRFSSELNEDSAVSIGEFVTLEAAYAIANGQDQAGFNGDGTSTYGGMFGVMPKVDDGNHAGSIYTAVAGNTAFSTLDMADFEGVLGQIPQYAVNTGNAKWYISRVGFYQSMQRLIDAGGGNTIDLLASGGNPQGNPVQFLGFPVVISQVLNSTTAAQVSTVVCFFGDLRQGATFGERRGITMQLLTERYAELDQLAIKVTTRFDVNVHELGDSTNAGSLVALKTPGS